MMPPQRQSGFDDLARLVSEDIPRRTALGRIGAFMAAFVIGGPAEALGASHRKKCPKGHVLCGSRCCPKGYSCHTHKGKKTCTCASPKRVCNGTCLDVRSDPKHCGSCGKRCKSGEHCVSGRCKAIKSSTGQQTQTPTCSDGVRNGNETDVDCGGPNCPACTNGKNCLAPSDCISGVCSNGVCVAPPPACTADNCGAQHGCPPCTNGKTCATGADCTSGHCSGGVCVQCASAADCPPAASGSCQTAICAAGVCGTTANDTNVPADDGNPCTDDICVGGVPSHPARAGNPTCGSGKHCNAGTCVSDTCADGIKNGGETDVDCGGPDCPPCVTGKNCLQDNDCASNVCSGGICHEATCNDTRKNGSETDIDCGGPDCPPCALGKHCGEDSDCASGHCNQGVCANCSVPSDCGQSTECVTYTCPNGTCGQSNTQQGTVCQGGVCDGNGTCVVDTQNDVNNCGSIGHVCSFPHATAACVAGICKLQACDPGFLDCDNNPANGCEFQGSVCPTTCVNDVQCSPTQFCDNTDTCVAKLIDGQPCSRGAQCIHGFCTAGVCASS